jgi:hypothetical protein
MSAAAWRKQRQHQPVAAAYRGRLGVSGGSWLTHRGGGIGAIESISVSGQRRNGGGESGENNAALAK